MPNPIRLRVPLPCQLCSAHRSEMISYLSATQTWLLIEDRPTPCTISLVMSILLSPGEPVVPLPVSHVSLDLEPTDQARVLLETCVAKVACLLLSRSGESGKERSIRSRREMPLPLPLLQVLALLSSRLVATESTLCQNFPLLSIVLMEAAPVDSSETSRTLVPWMT